MKNFFLSGALALLGVLFFASCEDDDYRSFMPTYLGFGFSQNGETVPSNTTFIGGDSVTISAAQATKGRLLNSTTYTWTISVGTTQIRQYTQNVIYDVQNGDPIFKFAVPDTSAVVTISFSGLFKYSGEGTIVDSPTYDDNTGNYSGRITRRNSSATQGTMGGSTTIRVVNFNDTPY